MTNPNTPSAGPSGAEGHIHADGSSSSNASPSTQSGTYQAPNIPEKFLKPYDPTETEPRIQALELATPETSIFNPDVMEQKGLVDPSSESAKGPFSIILPPPNVTGVLHLGHSLMVTIQDILIRKARMDGRKTLWIPGTDHAAIATQAVVEKEISKKEGKSRYDIGRPEMLRRIGEFATNSHDTIVSQVKRLGASLDWSREAFTLDDERNFAVRTMFKKMFDDGLIYRGFRIVNWDPKGQTTIADDELVYKEETTKLYYFKYGPFIISTARPETKFGDKYVVMHPDDARYAEYTHGDKLTVEWINGPIEATIIKDDSIDMEFGTGVMTITPWHSGADFALAEKYNLDKEQIIDKNGRLLAPIAGEFAGMKISEVRDKIVEKLASKGLVEKIEENYVHNIATAERTGGTIEPQIMNQWFVAVNKPFILPYSEFASIPSGSETTLKEIMRKAVETGHKDLGAIEILPDHFDKTYFHWIDNLNDWCISRQIWYGHRVPVWYRSKSGRILEKSGELHPEDPDLEIHCGVEAPAADPEGSDWLQDEDTLDTWFSAGIWSFSTMGWPHAWDEAAHKAKPGTDLATFHPTNVLVTGYEILFFWVARMILMTGYGLGTIPFKTVYLNGTVRDSKGQKMSKSLGNGGDPIQISEKYGADALRMFYAMSTTPGMDSRIYEDKIKGFKHFGNKLWNITRFVLSAIAENPETATLAWDKDFFAGQPMSPADNADDPMIPRHVRIWQEWKTALTDISTNIDNYRIHLAAETLYHYVWHTFADKILEESKPILKPDFLKNAPADILTESEKAIGETEAEKIILSEQHHADGTGTEDEEQKRDTIAMAQTLLTIHREVLLAAHPFMPHITQEIWSLLPQEMRNDDSTHGMISTERWPQHS
jgi:valyl-tRNA synthetase